MKAMGYANLSSCTCVGEEIIIKEAELFFSVVTNCCILKMQVSCLVAFGVPPDSEHDMI